MTTTTPSSQPKHHVRNLLQDPDQNLYHALDQNRYYAPDQNRYRDRDLVQNPFKNQMTTPMTASSS